MRGSKRNLKKSFKIKNFADRNLLHELGSTHYRVQSRIFACDLRMRQPVLIPSHPSRMFLLEFSPLFNPLPPTCPPSPPHVQQALLREI